MSQRYLVYRPAARPLADRLLQQYESIQVILERWECEAIHTDELSVIHESRMADFLRDLGQPDARGGYQDWLRQRG